MFLIILSIVCGLLGVLLIVLTIDGSKVSELFIFAMWIIGFLSPGLYVLEQLYKQSKKKINFMSNNT